MQDSALILAILLVLAGLVGVVVPGIPGPPLLFMGLLLAAWAEDFVYVGLWTLVVLGVLAVVTYVIDILASLYGARRFGASKRAIIGALIGTVVGILLGFPAVLFGPFAGAVIGELSHAQGWRHATRAGIGATFGLILGTALKIALSFTMIGIFLGVRFLL
jgi:uncharacterized protein